MSEDPRRPRGGDPERKRQRKMEKREAQAEERSRREEDIQKNFIHIMEMIDWLIERVEGLERTVKM